MSDIPQQALGKDICVHCAQPIHLANHQLGPTWLHSDDLPWCALRAVPAGRPWPEEAS